MDDRIIRIRKDERRRTAASIRSIEELTRVVSASEARLSDEVVRLLHRVTALSVSQNASHAAQPEFPVEGADEYCQSADDIEFALAELLAQLNGGTPRFTDSRGRAWLARPFVVWEPEE
jgi:hypothetical protein